MPSFSEQFAAAKAQMLAEVEWKAKQVLLEVGDRLLEYSPVGDWPSWSKRSQQGRPMPPYVPGQFKGSWHHSTGAPSTDTSTNIDKSGESSRAEFVAGITAQPFGVHYFTNNVPYALKLELGNHSDQVPVGGMVGKVAAEFPEIARRVVPEGYGV